MREYNQHALSNKSYLGGNNEGQLGSTERQICSSKKVGTISSCYTRRPSELYNPLTNFPIPSSPNQQPHNPNPNPPPPATPHPHRTPLHPPLNILPKPPNHIPPRPILTHDKPPGRIPLPALAPPITLRAPAPNRTRAFPHELRKVTRLGVEVAACEVVGRALGGPGGY